MTEKQFEALIEYFTGTAVAHNSIMMGHSEPIYVHHARQFFKARDALGIRGYISKEDAMKDCSAFVAVKRD
jgi:hypothetical protein